MVGTNSQLVLTIHLALCLYVATQSLVTESNYNSIMNWAARYLQQECTH